MAEQQPKSVAQKIGGVLMNNLVTILFVAFTLLGFYLSSGISVNYFLGELSERVVRNAFLVLSLIIPVIAGLGLNFGIVVGAVSGQLAIIFVRYFGLGGLSGLLLACLVALPLAVFFGYLTGVLFNKTRGQEMIAGLIVGYFANGIYQLILLVMVGTLIPVAANNPIIKPDGVGVRMTVDLGAPDEGGMKYALDGIWSMPFMQFVLILCFCILVYMIIQYVRQKKNPSAPEPNLVRFCGYCVVLLALIGISVFAIATNHSLMMVRKVPVVTVLVIFALCLFTNYLLKTKLGQDMRAIGQSQHIAQVSGINVEKLRIIATIFSTVLAAWGMIIYQQNVGTLSVYDVHRNIGLWSVAALLVGGASTSKANVKHALLGVALFNSMTIVSTEVAVSLFGDAAVGEYFRTFMVYGVIGLALGIYVWRGLRASKNTL